MNPSELEKSILKTISYFDLFNFPLTAKEIRHNLFSAFGTISLPQLHQALTNLRAKNQISSHEGFYFLNNKGFSVPQRKKHYLLAIKKMKKARPFIYLVSRAPFIKAIFICNNLAYQNAPVDSDIDLAIITSSKRIWTARFFSTLLLKLLKKRPTPKNQTDKICLSFYITEDNLNLEAYAYENDIHFVYWINQFLPIFIENNLDEKFIQANAWTKQYLPQAKPIKSSQIWQIHSCHCPFKKFVEKILQTFIGQPIEAFFKWLQLRIMPAKLKTLAKQENTNVIISDKILKFHSKDNRLETLKRWQELSINLK